MTKKKQTQIQFLEVARGERGLGVYKFCEHLGITGAWYYECLKNKRAPLSPKTLSELAVDQIGTWVGDLAVDCIKLDDARFVPCVCQTALWDNGPCPKHGESPELVAVELAEVAA